MHDTAYRCGILFGKLYGKNNFKVLDVGGQNVNGSLKSEYKNMEYTCLDIEKHDSVDVVMKPGEKFPFDDSFFDLVISTSCFEHDPCFWITFREMCRVTKKDGFIYVNAPSNGIYHNFPCDNWRFYSDAGQALAYWASRDIEGTSYPVNIEETFHIFPKDDIWIDFVCVWKRSNIKENNVIISKQIRDNKGKLRLGLESENFLIKSFI